MGHELNREPIPHPDTHLNIEILLRCEVLTGKYISYQVRECLNLVILIKTTLIFIFIIFSFGINYISKGPFTLSVKRHQLSVTDA